jgi:serine protease AprX
MAMRSHLAWVVLLLGCARVANVAPPRPADEDVLYVRDLVFDPVKGPPGLDAALRAPRETGYSLVQYEPGAGDAVHGAVIAAGGRIYDPVARNGLLVGGVPLARLRAIQGVRSAAIYEPAYKLAASLRTAAAQATEPMALAISVFENADDAARAIEALGGKAEVVHAWGGDAVVATVPPARLAEVAAVPSIRSIEPATMPLPELDVAPTRIGVRANAGPPWANIHGLTGQNQVLGIYDTGCDTGNSGTLFTDLRDRVTGDIAGWTNPLRAPSWEGLDYQGNPSAHGTFVSDVAIGNGASSANNLLTGIAFQATAVMRPFNADSAGLQPGYLAIGTALQNAYNANARVHNNSWVPATGIAGNLLPILNTYSQQGSYIIDTFVRANPAMLIVTSAGNYGNAANTIGTLSNSKNSLVVGNAGNGTPPTGDAGGGHVYDGVAPNAMAASSSRGPAVQNRLRPEVCAPGAQVAMRCPQSMVNNNTCPTAAGASNPPYLNQPGFAYAGGTSFSTPMVSGAAILLRQFLNTASQLPTPTGMLMKALLVNGTNQLYNYVPDNAQGWGEINLAQSIDGFGGGNTMYYDSLNEHGAAFQFTQTGQSVYFPDVVFTNAVPLRITLTWYDPADGTYAGVLVDDLDLTLTTADGTVYHGGVASMQNGLTQANGAADNRNNTEKIVLAATPAGNSTITVTATHIAAQTRQAFALAVSSVDHQGAASRSAAPSGATRGEFHLLSPQASAPPSPAPQSPSPPGKQH